MYNYNLEFLGLLRCGYPHVRYAYLFLNLHGYVWTRKNELKTVTCGRGSFCNRENIYPVSNLHGYVWAGPNVYLAKYSRYRKSSYSSTRIRVNELSNLNKNTQNLSILVRYANFYVKNLRTNNDKMTHFIGRESHVIAVQPPLVIKWKLHFVSCNLGLKSNL